MTFVVREIGVFYPPFMLETAFPLSPSRIRSLRILWPSLELCSTTLPALTIQLEVGSTVLEEGYAGKGKSKQTNEPTNVNRVNNPSLMLVYP